MQIAIMDYSDESITIYNVDDEKFEHEYKEDVEAWLEENYPHYDPDSCYHMCGYNFRVKMENK